MKIFITLIVLISIPLLAQPWEYDFGTGTGTFNTASTSSETFLPTPTTGTARVYIGNAGGQFELSNPAIVGSGSELIGIASTGSDDGLINKFSIYEISNPSPEFSLRFSVRLEDGVAGSEWVLFFGDGNTPGYYSNDVEYFSGAIFCGIKWEFTATSAINTYVNLGNWGSSLPWGIVTGTNYVFELFANNTGSAVSYTYGGSEQVAANSYDLWIDGVKVRDDDSRGNNFTRGPDITSFLFMGRESGSNTAKISIDDITYSNTVEDGPLPVELTSFTASVNNNQVLLEWATDTEVNNYGFDIERKDGNAESTVGQFEKIGFVDGNGNSNSPKYYSFEDKALRNSIYSYRLKQIDNDGKYEYSDAIEVYLGVPMEYSLLQNYPNPFNPSTTIQYQIPQSGNVTLKVYDMLGNEVALLVDEKKEQGNYQISFDASDLSSGIYTYHLSVNEFVDTKKMILVK